MAKARWLKPEFFTDPKVSAVSDQAALCYPALWVEADDGGVAPGDPRILYGRRFITRPGWSIEIVEACLRELDTAGLIVRFQHGDPWVWIPKLIKVQATKPKEWRHLGPDHNKVVKELQARLVLTAQVLPQSNAVPTPSTAIEPSSDAIHPLAVAVAEAGAVAEADSVLRTEATPRPEPEQWDNRTAAKHLRALCYAPDGKPPPGADIAEDLRFWKRCLAAGQPEGRIVAALHGLPHVMHTGGKWSPARVFGKHGDWVSLFERAVTEDGKHGRPSHLGAELQRLSTPPMAKGASG